MLLRIRIPPTGSSSSWQLQRQLMTSRLPPVDKLMTVQLRAVKEAADNLRGAEAELNRRVVEAIRGRESVAATSRAMGLGSPEVLYNRLRRDRTKPAPQRRYRIEPADRTDSAERIAGTGDHR